MIQSKLAALLLATATVGAGPVLFTPSTAHAQAEAEVSFEFFNDSLAPYGDWIEVGDYGLCWRPNDVGEDWAPYTDGYWSYTDAGWTWVSYEDFGGITYHYGRWVFAEDEGWCWVPDYEWGPAWVSWRNNDEYVGWAPLPPEARWEPTVGFSTWVDNSYDIGPSYYNFCPVEDFGAPVIREVIVPRPRNVVIIEKTVNITNITVNNFVGVPFCGGPRYDLLISRVRRPIPALKLVRETNITNIYNNTVINKTVIRNGGVRARAIHAVQQGNQLIVAAPRIKRVANPLAALPQIKPKRTVPVAKVRKGWNLVQDVEQRARIKQKFAQEAKGLRPESAPARAIQAVELKPVPEKADPNAPSPVLTGGRGNRNGRNGRDGRPDRGDRPDPTTLPGQPANVAVQPGTQPAGVNDNRPGRERDRDRRNRGENAAIAPGEPAPGTPNPAATTPQPVTPPNQPAPQTADTNDDRPDKPGREKGQRNRGENPGALAGERSPLRPFNGGAAPNAPGRNKDRQKDKPNIADVGQPTVTPPAPEAANPVNGNHEAIAAAEKARQERLEKLRKDKEQISRAAEVQEEFRKRQREQAQANRMERNQQQPQQQQDGERAERQQEAAQAAAAEARREQQENAREQAAVAKAERQRDAMTERQREAQAAAAEGRREQQAQAAAEARRQQQSQAAGEARRQHQQQQQENVERRQQQMQAEAAHRRAQQAQSEAAEQRREQAAAAQARREQMQAMQRQQAARQQQIEAQQERAQAMRQQQAEAQRQMQAQRAEQMQAQREQQAQAQRQQQMQAQRQQQAQAQGGGGGGEGRGRGRRGDKDKEE